MSSRIGVKSITELSSKLLSKEEQNKILASQRRVSRSVLDDDSSDSLGGNSNRDQRRQRKVMKTNLALFEKHLSKEKKGSFRVWKTTLPLMAGKKVNLFLHAVHDSKVVFRVSTKYGALPLVTMSMTELNDSTRKKELVSVSTSGAHKSFRMKMGFNDQSDAKRSTIGLSSKYYNAWPKHLVAKTLEDTVINGYNNYLLDPNCKVESWPIFLYELVQEFITCGANMRTWSGTANPRRSYHQGNKRRRPGGKAALLVGKKCRGASHLGNIKDLSFKDRTRACAFCGRQKALYRCRSCGSHLCMKTPQDQPSGKSYPANGPCCFLRMHGIDKFPQLF